MPTAIFYRIASVALVLYATGHQLGFRKGDPKWNADATIAAMKVPFEVSGQMRSYWDFFSGFGFFCTALLLFSAVLAWQLGSLAPEVLRQLRLARWAFAICYLALTVMTWRYFFPIPTIFS